MRLVGSMQVRHQSPAATRNLILIKDWSHLSEAEQGFQTSAIPKITDRHRTWCEIHFFSIWYEKLFKGGKIPEKPRAQPAQTLRVLPPTKNTNTLLPTPPPHQLDGGSVAIVVWFEGPLGGQTEVLGLLVGQFGQLHSEFIQVGSCDLLVQLWTQRNSFC